MSQIEEMDSCMSSGCEVSSRLTTDVSLRLQCKPTSLSCCPLATFCLRRCTHLSLKKLADGGEVARREGDVIVAVAWQEKKAPPLRAARGVKRLALLWRHDGVGGAVQDECGYGHLQRGRHRMRRGGGEGEVRRRGAPPASSAHSRVSRSGLRRRARAALSPAQPSRRLRARGRRQPPSIAWPRRRRCQTRG